MHVVQRSFEEAWLRLPVEITKTDHGDCENLPCLSLSSWVQFLVKEDKLDHLYGGLPADEVEGVFKLLWTTYRKLEPDLAVYDLFDAGKLDMGSTIMMTTHQDEGRGILALIILGQGRDVLLFQKCPSAGTWDWNFSPGSSNLL